MAVSINYRLSYWGFLFSEEMEAAAVAKSTATALNNVLGELRALGVSFETTDKLERSLEAKGVSKV